MSKHKGLRRTGFKTGQAAGQQRIVNPDGAHANQDGITLRPQEMNAGIGFGTGDRGLLTGPRGDLAVG